MFLVEVVGNGLEPEWPGEIAEKRGLTAEVWKWMRSCWEREPSARTNTEGLRADIVELATGSIAEIKFTPRWFAESTGRIRRVGKETMKRGWFNNAWNVELTVPLDGVPEKKEEWKSVTARIVDAAGPDGSRVSCNATFPSLILPCAIENQIARYCELTAPITTP